MSQGPGGPVVFAEQTPGLRHVGSLLAVCQRLRRLVKVPEARPRREPIVALEEDWYAHGRAQLPVRHHGSEPVPLLDLVEDRNDPVALVDLPSGRIEEQHYAL